MGWTTVTLLVEDATGEGSVALPAGTEAVVAEVTAVPGYAWAEPGTASYYRGLGWLAWRTGGNLHRRNNLHFESSQFGPVPADADALYYRLALNVTCTLRACSGAT